MKKFVNLFLLLGIILFSGFLYFYKLREIPNGVYVDEASVAYNAYSIFLTGKDEYGVSNPIFFRLLGSYSPSLFIYLTSLLLKYFSFDILLFRSLTVFSVLLSVVLFYLLSKKMKLYKLSISYFVITFFYAISPWLVFNAKLGYETTLGFVIFTVGTYFLFLSLKNAKNLSFATFFLSLSTYISHNQRFLAPLMLLGFLIFYKKEIFKKENKIVLLTCLFIGLAIHIPHFFFLGTKAFWVKSAQFSLRYLSNILVYLSPKTLFYENPDIDMQHTIPKLSMMFNWMVIPYFIGLYLLVKNISDYRYKYILLYSGVTLIPSVVSSAFISEQKVLPFIIPLFIILGLGIDSILKRTKSSFRIILFALIAFYSFLMLYSSYFVLFPKERVEAWNYGYDQIAQYIKNNPDKNFLIDHTRNPRAYILLLYHLKYDPAKYQKEVDSFYKENYYKAPDPAQSYKFSNIEVRSIDWKIDPKQNCIIIGDPLSISSNQAEEHNLIKVNEFKDLSGNIIFEAFEAK